VAVNLVAVLHLFSDDDNPYQIVNTLMDAVPAGSYLTVSHLANDLYPEQMAELARGFNEQAAVKVILRDRAEVPGSSAAWSLWTPESRGSPSGAPAPRRRPLLPPSCGMGSHASQRSTSG
jgi:hypothetical protein